MKKFYYIFKASLEKTIKELSRYRFNTISYFLTLYIWFLMMFSGVRSFGISLGASPIDVGNSLEGFIAGYFLWTVISCAYSDIAYSIVNDASKGTLEQLNMSSMSLSTVLVVRGFANLLIDILFSMALLFIIMKTTNHWLEIEVFSILIPIFIGVFSILGIGLICGGLALIFKKVQSLLNMIQFFLIALIAITPKSKVVLEILPFRYVAEKLYLIMMDGYSFTDFSALDYGIMIANSVVYFSIGVLVFNQCVKIAKSRGLLGQY